MTFHTAESHASRASELVNAAEKLGLEIERYGRHRVDEGHLTRVTRLAEVHAQTALALEAVAQRRASSASSTSGSAHRASLRRLVEGWRKK